MQGIVIYVVVVALLALIPAKIAANKGRSFATWYVFGLLLWVIALVAALLVKDESGRSAHA